MQQSRTGGPVWGYVCAVLVRWRWGVSEWLYRRLFSVALFSGMPNMALAVIRARAAVCRLQRAGGVNAAVGAQCGAALEQGVMLLGEP